MRSAVFFLLVLRCTALTVADSDQQQCSSPTEIRRQSSAEVEEKMSGTQERTFIMIKPDAVQRGIVGEIIKRFEQRGYRLIAMKMMHASVDHLKEHYRDLKDKPFFPDLIKYMSSGPVVPMVFEGLEAVKQGRIMLGATNPLSSAPGTIRGDFSIQTGRNIVHGSDSVESAMREIAHWFKPEEQVEWKRTVNTWIYE